MNRGLTRAASLAAELEAVPWQPRQDAGAREDAQPRIRFAIGDPQASLEKLLAIIDLNGLLGREGFLVEDVSLLSAGDHFDFPGDPATVGREGLRILRWLAEHPPEQVIILAGNHDLCRVMEFAAETDGRFAAARAVAAEIARLKSAGPQKRAELHAARRRFHSDFPGIPTPEVVLRDFLSFSESQRSLVQRLLLGGRFALAHAARLGVGEGREALLTHAGVTGRELSLLGLPQERDPLTLARRLNAELRSAIERVRPSWEQGAAAALDLAPLHVAGTTGREGGGLLYHRPSNPLRPAPGASDGWEPGAPRRFDPREMPRGVLQVCGHSGHKSCLRELAGWVAPSAAAFERGGLRTLRTRGNDVIYEAGITPVPDSEAAAYLIDAEMHWVEAKDYPLLPVSEWIV